MSKGKIKFLGKALAATAAATQITQPVLTFATENSTETYMDTNIEEVKDAEVVDTIDANESDSVENPTSEENSDQSIESKKDESNSVVNSVAGGDSEALPEKEDPDDAKKKAESEAALANIAALEALGNTKLTWLSDNRLRSPRAGNIVSVNTPHGLVQWSKWAVQLGDYNNAGVNWDAYAQMAVDGKKVYCVDPLWRAIPGTSMNSMDMSAWTALTPGQIERLEYIVALGYGYSGDTSDEMDFATQIVIWQYLNYCRPDLFTMISDIHPDIQAKINLINSRVSSIYDKRISFNGATITVRGYGAAKGVSVTDTSGVFGSYYYESANPNNILNSKSGNTLKVWGELGRPKSGIIQYALNQPLSYGSSIFYYDSVSQNAIIANPTQLKASVNVRIIGEGYGQVKKYDKDGEPVQGSVIQFTYNGTTTNVTTDANGIAKLPVALPPGTSVTAVEISAPSGYLINPNPVTGTIVEDQTITFNIEDPYRFGKASFSKIGQRATDIVEKTYSIGFKKFKIKQFVYSDGGAMAGTQWTLYAAANIYKPNGKLAYAQGEEITVATSDGNGDVSYNNLFRGKYCAKETYVPKGSIDENLRVDITINQDFSTTVSKSTVVNKKQKIRIELSKVIRYAKGLDNNGNMIWGEFAPDYANGEVFGLYSRKDLTVGGKTIKANTDLLGVVEVKNGKAIMDDMYLPESNSYYIKELIARPGNDLIEIDFDVSYVYENNEAVTILKPNGGNAIVNTEHTPNIGTTLHGENGVQEKIFEPEGTVKLIDIVDYDMLLPGTKATFKGTLMDKSTGQPILENGTAVTASTTLDVTEANYINGKVEVVFEVDASLLKGKTIVAFEDLVYDDTELMVEHHDINDVNQTVEFISPKVQTTAKNAEDNQKVSDALDEVTIKDKINYSNLIKGHKYKVVGTLMTKDDAGNPTPVLDKNGKKVTSTKIFIAQAGAGVEVDDQVGDNLILPVQLVSGSVEVEFTFDATGMQGKDVVVFESIYRKNKEIASHANIEDKCQTIVFPDEKIKTTAWGTEDQTQITDPLEKFEFKDTVSYTNIIKGKVYKMTGTLMVKETNKPLLVDGKEQNTTVWFRADGKDNVKIFRTERNDGKVIETGGSMVDINPGIGNDGYTAPSEFLSGKIELPFIIDASALRGQTIVTFESLSRKDIELAVHEDINDDAQSIEVTDPEIKTTMINVEDDTHVSDGLSEVTFKDVVEFKGLIKGKKYKTTGNLMVRETGKAALDKDGKPYETTVEFIAGEGKCDVLTGDEEIDEVTGEMIRPDGYVTDVREHELVNGYVELTFTVDASVFKGQSIVAFESLSRKDQELAVHEDIEDDKQTIKVLQPEIKTTLLTVENEIHSAHGLNEVEVFDVVEFKGLIEGKKYRITGKLMVKSTGKELTDENGEIYETTVEFIAGEGECDVTVLPENNQKLAEKNAKANFEYEWGKTQFDKEAVIVDGYVKVPFKISTKDLVGDSIVAYEKLFRENDQLTEHEDPEDEDQTVDILDPKIKTTLLSFEDDIHFAHEEEEVEVYDVVEFKGLIKGNKYKITGTLMVKSTGEELKDEDGNIMTTTVEFIAGEGECDVVVIEDEKSEDTEDGKIVKDKKVSDYVYGKTKFGNKAEIVDGYVKVPFKINAKDLQGESIVAYEKLYYKDEELTEHEDIDDEDQTLEILNPEIKTTLLTFDKDIHGSHAIEEMKVYDVVEFKGLIEGKKYRITGTLMIKSTGEAATDEDGNVITTTVEFIAGSGECEATVIKNEETDEDTENESDENSEESDNTETVETKKVTEVEVPDYVYGETTFAKDTPIVNGYVKIPFVINAKELAGESIVAYEKLYVRDTELAEHEDIDDEDQTVLVVTPELKTTATNKKDGSKELEIGKDQEIADVVEFTNLIEGKKYRLTGTLMDKDTEKPLLIDGKIQTVTVEFIAGEGRIESTVITQDQLDKESEKKVEKLKDAENENTPEETIEETTDEVEEIDVTDEYVYGETVFGNEMSLVSGSVEIVFTIDASELAGKEIVVFEGLGVETEPEEFEPVGEHKDINDEGQTVRVKKPYKPTSSASNTIQLFAIAVAIAAAGYIVYSKKRKSVL